MADADVNEAADASSAQIPDANANRIIDGHCADSGGRRDPTGRPSVRVGSR